MSAAATGALLGYYLGGDGLSPGGAAGAGAGIVIGAAIGWCSCRLSGRLRKIWPPGDPETGETTTAGRVIDTGRSSLFFPWGDGDYLINIECVSDSLLATQWDGSPACVRTKSVDQGPRYLHCEISSNVTSFGCVGMAVGAVIGGVIGTALGAAAGLALAAACLATGIFAPLCIVAALLVAALIGALGAAAGAQIGGAVGGGIGALADDIENQLGDAGADIVKEGDTVIFTGDWVTDIDHGWNEMHDLKRAMVVDAADLDCAVLHKYTAALAAGLKKAP